MDKTYLDYQFGHEFKISPEAEKKSHEIYQKINKIKAPVFEKILFSQLDEMISMIPENADITEINLHPCKAIYFQSDTFKGLKIVFNDHQQRDFIFIK